MRPDPLSRPVWRLAALVIAGGLTCGAAAAASPLPHERPMAQALERDDTVRVPWVEVREAPMLLAQQGDCSQAAAQAAAQTGGEVLSVSARSQNGRTICEVTVLIPGRDGERPRRTTITIPG